MRISDWSSDVCSSDLVKDRKDVPNVEIDLDPLVAHNPARVPVEDEFMVQSAESVGKLVCGSERQVRQAPAIAQPFGCQDIAPQYGLATVAIGLLVDTLNPAVSRFPIVPMQVEAFLRSEEHTSELQPLKCISYAFFC